MENATGFIAYTCPHCGKNLSISTKYAGQSGTCTFCKKPITVPSAVAAAPAARSDYAKHLKRFSPCALALCMGFFAGYEFRGYQIRSGLSAFMNRDPSRPNAPAFSAESLRKKSSSIVDMQISESVELATMEVTVDSVHEAGNLTKLGKVSLAPKDATYVVVSLTVKNRLQSPFDFNSNGFRLVDDKEREFDAISPFMVLEDYIQGRELAPGVAEKGNMAYLVPVDSVSYSLMVAKANSNEVYRVKLK